MSASFTALLVVAAAPIGGHCAAESPRRQCTGGQMRIKPMSTVKMLVMCWLAGQIN